MSSWELKGAVNRIFNTFKRVKNGIYKEDVEALNKISDFIDSKAQNTVEGNLLYAKCLLLLIRQNNMFYGDIKITLKTIDSELKQSLDYHLELLTMEFNNLEFINFAKSKGVDMDILKNDDSLVKQHKDEFQKKLLNSWNKSDLEKSFYKTANDFIKDVNNYA